MKQRQVFTRIGTPNWIENVGTKKKKTFNMEYEVKVLIYENSSESDAVIYTDL